MRFVLLFAVMLAWCAPLAAQADRDDDAGEILAIEADNIAYAAWLARIQEIDLSLRRSVSNFGPALQQAQAGGGGVAELLARLRRVVTQMLVEVNALHAQLEALGEPDFPALALEDDVRPAAIRRAMLQLNRQMHSAVEETLPLLEAANQRDLTAMRASEASIVESFRLMLESQIVVTRGWRGAAPRRQAAWNVLNFRVINLRVQVRLFDERRRSPRSGADAALAGDLLAFADQLESNAAAGSQRIEAELAMHAEAGARAEGNGDEVRARVARRAIAVLSVTRGYFPLSREIAAHLREEAQQLGQGPTTERSLAGISDRRRAFADQMNEIARRESAAMAGTQ